MDKGKVEGLARAVVRSQPDQQDTRVFRRALPSATSSPLFQAHRYHYPASPMEIRLGIRQSSHDTWTLTHHERDVTPGTLVLELLRTFTEQLAQGTQRWSGDAHVPADEHSQ